MSISGSCARKVVCLTPGDLHSCQVTGEAEMPLERNVEVSRRHSSQWNIDEGLNEQRANKGRISNEPDNRNEAKYFPFTHQMPQYGRLANTR